MAQSELNQEEIPTVPLSPFSFDNFLRQKQINVYFMGISETNINSNSLQDELPHSYAPIDIKNSINKPNIDFDDNFTISYNFIYLNSSHLNSFVNYANSVAFSDLAPLDSEDIYDKITYYPGNLIEKYLSNTYSGNTSSIFILNTFGSVSHQPHLYSSTFHQNIRYSEEMRLLAGGGENSSTLWIDLSTVDASYRDTGTFGQYGVNSSLIPTIDTYSGDQTGKDQLTQDIAFYISSAIEFRYLASKRHTILPYTSNLEIKTLVLVQETDDTSISVDFQHSELVRYIASNYDYQNITVDLELSEYSDYPLFSQMLQQNYNPGSMTYDSGNVIEFLLSNFEAWYSNSEPDTTLIPQILVVLQGDRKIPGLESKIIYDGNTPLFNFNHLNQNYLSSLFQENIVESSGQLNSNATYYNILANETKERITTNIENLGDPVSVQVLNQYNYNLFQNNDPYNTLSNSTVVGSETISFISNQSSTLYWVFNSSNPDYQFDISTMGLSNFSIIELINRKIGAFIGLSSPNFGYTWDGNKYYQPNSLQIFELWSQSNSITGIQGNVSFIDKQVVLQNHLQDEYNTIKSDLNAFYSTIATNNSYVPPQLENDLELIRNSTNLLNPMISTVAWWDNIDEISDILENLRNQSTNLIDIPVNGFSRQIEVGFNSTSVGQFGLILQINERLHTNIIALPDTPITLSNLGYAEFELQVKIEDTVYLELNGFSWELPDEININVSSTVSVSRTIPTTTTITSGNGSSNGGNVSVWAIITILLIPISNKIRQK